MQLMDAAFPGQIPLSKVNFNARFDYEFSSNFKILQTHFVKIKCDKVVPTDRLIKAKYQDNLEFMQWMKRFFEMQYSGEPYDAKARRKECKVEYASDKKSSTGSAKLPLSNYSTASSAATTTAATSATSGSVSSSNGASVAAASDARRSSMMPGTGSTIKPVRQSLMPTRTNGASGSRYGTSATAAAAGSAKGGASGKDAKVEELTRVCSELNVELAKSDATKEFYYDKLRAIEKLMSDLNPEEETVEGLKNKVCTILFSAEPSGLSD